MMRFYIFLVFSGFVALPGEARASGCSDKIFLHKLIEAQSIENHADAVRVLLQAHVRLGMGFHKKDKNNPVSFALGSVTAPRKTLREKVANLTCEALDFGSVKQLRRSSKVLEATFPITSKSFHELFSLIMDAYEKRDGYEKDTRFRDQFTAKTNEINDGTLAQFLVPLVTDEGINFKATLVDFWYNHFNVEAKDRTKIYVLDYIRIIDRCHEKGFRALLGCVLYHPAMNHYLQNYVNIKDGSFKAIPVGPITTGMNKNYARELLELHTLGSGPVNDLYSEKDVDSVARLLAGLGILVEKAPPKSKLTWRSPVTLFSPKLSVAEPQAIMGQVFKSGTEGIEQFLDFLSGHPSTKEFICGKIIRRIVGSNTARAMVDGCIEKWGSKGDLVGIYKFLLSQKETWAASRWQKDFKSPLEIVVSSLRMSGVTQVNKSDLLYLKGTLAYLGQPVLLVSGPDGYSEETSEWITHGHLAKIGGRLKEIETRFGENEHLKLSQVPETARRYLDEATNFSKLNFLLK